MKVEKRFAQGGTVLAAYTFSKLIADVGSLTTWLDSGVGLGATSSEPEQSECGKIAGRIRLPPATDHSYAVDLPFGQGQKFLNGGNGVVKKLVCGWTVSGSHIPGRLPACPDRNGTANVTGYGLRPNVVPGCNPVVSGSCAVAAERLVQRLVFHRSGRLHAGE